MRNFKTCASRLVFPSEATCSTASIGRSYDQGPALVGQTHLTITLVSGLLFIDYEAAAPAVVRLLVFDSVSQKRPLALHFAALMDSRPRFAIRLAKSLTALSAGVAPEDQCQTRDHG